MKTTKRGIIEINDFSKGLNTRDSDINNDLYSPDCLNVYNEGNKLRKRKGISKVNTSAVNSGNRGNGIYNWIRSSNEQWLVAVFGNKLYKMDSASVWDGTFDLISADSANGTPISSSIVHFITYSETLLFTTENRDAPQKMLTSDSSHFNIEYNGSGTAPKGKYIQVWKEHVWIMNIASGGSLSEDFDSISAWTAGTSTADTVAQTTFGGQETVHLVASATASDHATLTRDVGTLTDDYVVEIKTYFETLNTASDGDYAQVDFQNGVVQFQVRWSDDGLEIYDGTNWNEVGVNAVSEDVWNTWKFIVTAGTTTAAVVDVIKDGSYIGLQYSCANADTTSDGNIVMSAKAGGSGTVSDWYCDYLYINPGTAVTEYWTDSDFSDWTDVFTPNDSSFGPTLTPAIHLTFQENSAGNLVYNRGTQSPGGITNGGQTGTTLFGVTDSSATIPTSTVHTTAGKPAYSFNLAGSYGVIMETSWVQAVNADTAGAFSFWVKRTADKQIYPFRFEPGDTSNRALNCVCKSDGDINFAVWATTPFQLEADWNNANVTADEWVHLVVQQNGTELDLWRNGVQIGAPTSYETSTEKGAWFASVATGSACRSGYLGGAGNDATTIICGSAGGGTWSWGELADWRYYQGAVLTSAQIVAIYNEGSGFGFMKNPYIELVSQGTVFGADQPIHSHRAFPASHFKMNDTAASTVITDSGYLATDGTASVNASLITVGSGTAVIGTGISCTSASSHNINIDGIVDNVRDKDSGTICFWAMNDGTVGDVVLSFNDTDNDSSVNFQFGTSDTDFSARVRLNGTDVWRYHTKASTFSTNSWYHIAVVQDGEHPRLYVNGQPHDGVIKALVECHSWFSYCGTSLDNARIGCLNTNAAGNSDFFNGKLDDVRVYERALDYGEIYGMYLQGTAGTDTAVPAYPYYRSFRTPDASLISFNEIDEGNATTVNSNDELITVGETTNEFRGLLKFGCLANVPSDATIKAAALHLWTLNGGSASVGEKITVYQCLQAWTAAGANWNSYDGTNAWNTAGAKGSGTDFGSTAVGTMSITYSSTQFHMLTIGFNSTGVKAVQDWVDGSLANNGFLLVNATTDTGTNINIWTGKNQSQHPPWLECVYSVPEHGSNVGPKAGTDIYRIEGFGDGPFLKQTLSNGTALAGLQSIFGGWFKATPGTQYKFTVVSDSTEEDSSTFIGTGHWEYQTAALTPTSGVGTVDVKVALMTEGILEMDKISAIEDNSTATADDNADRLQRSANSLLNDWDGTDSGSNDIITPNDRGLTGSFILNDRMYVTKSYSIHQVTYTGSTPLLDIKRIRSRLGTSSPRTVKNVNIPGSGEIVIFLGTNRTLFLFDGFDGKPITDVITENNTVATVYMKNINTQALDKCFAILHEDRSWYELFVPIGNATLPTHSIIYDYLTGSFWVNDNRNFSAGSISDDGTGIRKAYALHNSTGFGYLLDDTNADDGSAINGYWTSGKIGVPTSLDKTDEINVQMRAVSGTPILKWRADFETDWVTKTVSSALEEVNYNPGRIDNMIQIQLADNSTTEGFVVKNINLLQRALGHGK